MQENNIINNQEDNAINEQEDNATDTQRRNVRSARAENITKRRHFKSPLIFSAEKFSRKCKIPEKKVEINPTRLGYILKSLYIYLLLAIDMIVFASSGNLMIFNNSIFPSFEVTTLLFMLMFFPFLVLGAFYKKPGIQNIICVVITFLFIIVFFNQFYQLDGGDILGNHVSEYLGTWTPKILFKYSHILIALFLASGFAYMIFHIKDSMLALYVSLFVAIFFYILHTEATHTRYQHDFIEIFSSKSAQSTSEKDKKFIYIMLPNLSSYKYFSFLNTNASRQAYDIITGFYAKNNFEVYPNSFIENDNQFLNVVQSINSFSDGSPDNHTLKTILLYKYWSFFNINDEYIFLKDNQMFDTFKKSGYNITAYKSRGIDICHKSHAFNVNRCMEKINKPVNLYDSELSKSDRTKLLLTEWLASMKLLSIKPMHKILNMFSLPERLPLIGVNYNNMYVINSVKTFDILAQHVLSDKGKNAYFVYADIPSDMFIYDEFCNIKPQDQWVNMYSLPWVKNSNTPLKQQAYIDQTKCLYGKLQQFIDRLNKNNVFSNSVMIINGISSTNNFSEKKIDDVVNDFIYDKMVTLAIKSPLIKKFKENKSVCSSKKVIHNMLYDTQAKTCGGVEDIGVKGLYKDMLLTSIVNKNTIDEDFSANIHVFDTWYNKWLITNDICYDSSDMITTKETVADVSVNEEAPKLENITLQ